MLHKLYNFQAILTQSFLVDAIGNKIDSNTVLYQYVPNRSDHFMHFMETQNLIWYRINDAKQDIEFYFNVGDSDINPTPITNTIKVSIHFLLRKVS